MANREQREATCRGAHATSQDAVMGFTTNTPLQPRDPFTGAPSVPGMFLLGYLASDGKWAD